MSVLLAQLAVIVGGLIALIAFGINMFMQNDWLVAAYRAGVVFFASVIILMVFFHFFALVLSRFVAEEVMKQKNKAQAAAESAENSK